MKTKGIIPSQNALRFCASMIRRFEHAAMMDAIVYGRLGLEKEVAALMEQSDDARQIAQFLEQYIWRVSPNDM